MSIAKEFVGHEVMIVDVSEEELKRYDQWLENETRWSGNMGWTCWPSDTEGRVMLIISSGFGGTWYGEILPALRAYWGEGRIINEVMFVEEAPSGIVSPPGKDEKYRVLPPPPQLFNEWASVGGEFTMRGRALLTARRSEPNGAPITGYRTVTTAEIEEWNGDIKYLYALFQRLYNETLQHITTPRE